MILQKVLKENVTSTLYKSSNVIASTYDSTNNRLNVTFKGGGSYDYLGVPETDYVRFETAESQGKVLNTVIKKYPFERQEDVNVDNLISEITKMKNEETKVYSEDMIDYMRMMISSLDSGNEMTNQSLKKLNTMISYYLDMINYE